MFTGSPTFVRFSSTSTRGGGFWWLLMVPGIALILLALAILVWPELLAYLVAGALLFGGLMLTGWGWTVRRLEKQSKQNQSVEYRVQ